MSRLILSGIALFLVAVTNSGAQEIGDPTKPPTFANDEVELTSDDRVFEVSAILTSRSRRVAVINEERVEIGGWVSGAQVLEIRPYEVVLHADDQILTISLSRTENFKTPASPKK